ncbi:site-specific integrase [Opitutaceae bacterium TAV4]|nr:site-specific integrase [Opitutaceae bacterium TAV4]RRK00885.1 site-specific integrase [Opitutaceae bacterium TAV3]
MKNLPYSVTSFTNRSGTKSWRVGGSWRGVRLRKNYDSAATAEAVCALENQKAVNAEAAAPLNLVQTRLLPNQIRAAEAAINLIAGRWPLADVVTAGIHTLKTQPKSQPVMPLLLEWLPMVQKDVGERWGYELEARLRKFFRDHSSLTTSQFTPALVREWIDGLGKARNTRANYRNAIHRFGAWLVERGHIKENPGGGIRISKKRTGEDAATMPSVLLAAQAEALLRAVEGAECRRLKGWVTLCLLCGLRPESEATRLTWGEVDFATGEMTVMGRKRGAKPRILKMQPSALAWLKSVKADKEPAPGHFNVTLHRRTVTLANEWIAKRRPEVPPITWDEDIQRHTYISMRAGQKTPMHEVAEECGTSTTMIYAHYKHPRPAAEVKAFWQIMPE